LGTSLPLRDRVLRKNPVKFDISLIVRKDRFVSKCDIVNEGPEK